MIDSQITVEQLNAMNSNTMMEHLGIEFTGVGTDFIEGKMPVDNRHHQPFGLLHGGASVTLAETLGSVGAHISVNRDTHFCVGLEINANHLRSVKSGFIHGVARPVHLGNSTQVWEIHISDDDERPVCISRLTISVLEKK